MRSRCLVLVFPGCNRAPHVTREKGCDPQAPRGVQHGDVEHEDGEAAEEVEEHARPGRHRGLARLNRRDKRLIRGGGRRKAVAGIRLKRPMDQILF